MPSGRVLNNSHGSFRRRAIVEVFVGPGNFLFPGLSKERLCEVSPYFRTTLQRAPFFNFSFRGSNNQSIHLPDVEVATFDFFLQWLNYQSIQLAPPQPSAARQVRYLQLVKLWILGQKLGVTALQNQVVERLLATANSGSKEIPDIERCIRYAYEHTVRGSQLRRFLVTLRVSRSSVGNWRHAGNQAALAQMPEFSSDVIVAMAERIFGRIRHSPNIDARQFYCRG